MATNSDFATANVNDILDQLTLNEKVNLLGGVGWWNTYAIPRLGVPSIKMSDGPNGVRGSSHFMPTPANCIPCGTALGATFDVDLLYEIAGLLGRDCKAKGSSLLLAPTVNIQRYPTGGRAFESFSEDPFLSGTLASAYINGLQEKGKTGAVIKHFVANDQENSRTSVSSEIRERVLREIYLYPFMLAQKLSKPWSVMSAYNRVNGTHVSEDKRLLDDVLRKEWGFDGLIMSDWFGCYSTDKSILAGLDLEMPGPSRYRGQAAMYALQSGKLTETEIDARALEVLKIVQKAVQVDPETVKHNHEPEKGRQTPGDSALNRKVAANAIVLLKNQDDILPIDASKISRVLVCGPNAKVRTVSGGGSAYLTSHYTVTALQGIQSALKGSQVQVDYAPGWHGHREMPMFDGWMTSDDGSPGWTARLYNEVEDGSMAKEPISTCVLRSSRVRINDQKPEGLEDNCWIRTSGFIVAEEDGPFDFGLTVVGRAKLYVDGELVIDNGFEKRQTPGTTFYGAGSIEEVGTTDFKKGQKYHIEVLYSSRRPEETLNKKGQPMLIMAAFRLGGCAQISSDSITRVAEMAKTSDVVICVTGSDLLWEAEGADRTQWHLPGKTDQLVEALLKVKPNTIICNQSGSAFAMPWADRAKCIMQSWFGGDESGNAIADVVFGNVNPSGRMPVTFPHRLEDCSAHMNWGDEEGKVYYGEGLYVGYKGYELAKSDPLFAFGEGLSYTHFEWSDMQVEMKEGNKAEDITGLVKLIVTNRGGIAGAEVVQLYVRDVASALPRPLKEFKGCVKVFLEPGQKQELTITLNKYTFSYYVEREARWRAESGEFELILAKSSRDRDAVLSARTVLRKTTNWVGV